MKNKTHEQIILEYLKTVPEATPTKIRDETKVHFEVVKYILLDLENKNKVVKRENQMGTFVYWRIKK